MGGGWVSRRAVVAAKPGTRCSGMVERVAGEKPVGFALLG